VSVPITYNLGGMNIHVWRRYDHTGIESCSRCGRLLDSDSASTECSWPRGVDDREES